MKIRTWLAECLNLVTIEDYMLLHHDMTSLASALGTQIHVNYTLQKQLMNSLFVIHPYKQGTLWMFDDERRGIVEEPFVGEINGMIDRMLSRQDMEPDEPFTAVISAAPFPNYTMHLTYVGEENGGHWYECDGKQGWLCPVLTKFFPVAPKDIYVKAVEEL